MKMDNSTQQQSMAGPSADNPKSSKSVEIQTSVQAGNTGSRNNQGNERSITNNQNQNKRRELRLPQRSTNQKASSKPNINLDGVSNLSWRQRPAPMSQTLQKGGNDRYGNSGRNDMVGRHRNSFGASQSNGKAIPNIHQKQQFRNGGASDQSVRINSTSFSNRGQFNRNRNQLSDNHERSKGQSFENGNFHRRRTENHPT